MMTLPDSRFLYGSVYMKKLCSVISFICLLHNEHGQCAHRLLYNLLKFTCHGHFQGFLGLGCL